MAYSSRTRSRSVSTAPFTFATGFPVGTAKVALGTSNLAGWCEATWPAAVTAEPAMIAKMSKRFMSFFLVLRVKLRRGTAPSPDKQQLERRDCGAAATLLVCLSTMALAAELRRLIRVRGG